MKTSLQSAGPVGHSSQHLRSATWLDCDATLALAQKTRRAVRDEVISGQQRRVRQHRSLAMAIIGSVFLLVVMAPGLWNGVEDLLAGEHLLDLPPLLAFSVVLFFPAMLAALIALWMERRSLERDRQ